MKTMKKLLLSTALVLSVICGTSMTSFAANTTDQDIDFSVNATNFKVKTSAASKENRTPVYLYIKSLQHNNKVQVRALGYANGNTENLTENGTTGNKVSYVTCNKHTYYSIHSQIKESGYSYAQLAFRSKNAINPERVTGVWSPDSTRTYTDAWQ